MQTTNNYVPTIIERSASKCKRHVCGSARRISYYKKASHRSYRRMMSQQLHGIASGYLDPEEYNDEPGHCKCTGWDID